MFYFPLIARRAAPSKARPSSSRPRLESLEDRLVPNGAPPNGTILFANYSSTFDGNPGQSAGILGLEPDRVTGKITGVQSQKAVNGSLAAGSTPF